MTLVEEKKMTLIQQIRKKAKTKKRRVVLPEGEEPRMIQAARILTNEGIANVTLLGDESVIQAEANKLSLDISGIDLVNPKKSMSLENYTSKFMELRKAKGITEQEAKEAMVQPLYFGAMMVADDQADASVAGSVNTTGAVLRSAIQVIGLKAGIKAVSSSFLMTIPEFRGESEKLFMFGDCAVIPNPNPQQLASIAVSTAETLKFLTGEEPKVALLSFSTKGSASHADVDKVLATLEILKADYPELKVDGELQLDAAILPEVAAKKSPNSPLGGDANVLIFPDLDAGNIGYKLVQRLAGAIATGPIIQGLAKPANDLSRGCSVDDIVDVSAIATLLRG